MIEGVTWYEMLISLLIGAVIAVVFFYTVVF
jgi:hypothetical protein